VFGVVEKNVQVNGFDWDKADPGVEGFLPLITFHAKNNKRLNTIDWGFVRV